MSRSLLFTPVANTPVANDEKPTADSPFSPSTANVSPITRDFLVSPEISEAIFSKKIRNVFLTLMMEFQKSEAAKKIPSLGPPPQDLTVPVFFAALEIAVALNKKCSAIAVDTAVGELSYFYVHHFFYSLASLEAFGKQIEVIPETDQDFLKELLTRKTMGKLAFFPHYIKGLSFYVFASLADKLGVEASVLFQIATTFARQITTVPTLQEKENMEKAQKIEGECWADIFSYTQGSLEMLSHRTKLYLLSDDPHNRRDPLLTLIGMLFQKKLLNLTTLKQIIEHGKEWRDECNEALRTKWIPYKKTIEEKLSPIFGEDQRHCASKRGRDSSGEEGDRRCKPRT